MSCLDRRDVPVALEEVTGDRDPLLESLGLHVEDAFVLFGCHPPLVSGRFLRSANAGTAP